MKKTIIILTVLFALSLAFDSCKKDGPGSIYGIVTEKSTAEPMRATGVALYSKNESRDKYELLLKTVTYDDGHYEFTDLEPGSYRLYVDAEGYIAVTYDVIVEAERQARADLQLSPVVTYMTVITMEATEVNVINTVLHGECKYSHSVYKPDEVGFYYGSSEYPSRTGSNIKSSNISNGSFSAVVAGPLEPGTYYIQAYAKNGYGTTFGETKTFAVLGNPSVETLAASNVKETTATLNGKVLYEGNPKYTEKGFVYSASFPNPTIDDRDGTIRVQISGIGPDFSTNISWLTKDQTYYARAYITNENGTFYGKSISFTTSNPNIYILQSVNLMVLRYDLSAGSSWSEAMQLCDDCTIGGYDDWYLPSRGELGTLYINKDNIGGFEEARYWSREEHSRFENYYIDFYDGESYYTDCTRTYHVRPVRRIN